MGERSGKKRSTKGESDAGTGKDVVQFVDLMRSQSSVEVKRDGKGNVSMSVKAYADTTEEAEKLAAQTFERLNKRFKTGD